MDKAAKKKASGGWLKNPKIARAGETIGGGHFVFRRGDGTKRIRPSMWPFEYASMADAEAQARKLANENLGYRFDVVSVQKSFIAFDIAAKAHTEDAG